MTNVCVIGHGMMGVWHTEALAGMEDARLHVVVGRRPEPTAEFAARYGYRRWCVDLDEALSDPAVDVAIVAGPSETHAAMATAALRAGKHVLVEIPAAMTHADTAALVGEAERADRMLGVVHPMRFRTEHRRLVDRLRSGEEHVRHVHARMFTHRLENVGATGYRRSWTDNILWHHGAHLADVGLWLAGSGDASQAYRDIVVQQSFMPERDPGTGIPMELNILAGLAGDRSIVCTSSYYCRERIFDVFVVTDRNSYRLDILSGTLTTGGGEVRVSSEQDNNAQVARDFVEAVHDRRAPHVTGRDVLPAMRLLQDVEDGRSVVAGREGA